MAKKEWNVTVRKDGGAVRIYRWGKLQEELKPGKDTYEAPAGAIKFAEELYGELRTQSAAARKRADHDVQTEPNLKNDATGSDVKGKPSPTTSNMEDKVAKLQGELRKTKAQLGKERRRHVLEIKARRGAKLAEILVKRGALKEDENAVKAFVKDVAMMSDDEIGRLERKAGGDAEFGSVEEAERAERTYKREARILLKKAEDAHEAGDTEAADGFDAAADDAQKNADCCRTFIRSAAHKDAADKGNCGDCGKPNFLCKGKCKGADDAGEDEKEAAAEACDCKEGSCECAKEASVETVEDAGDESGEKTADHDVQEEPNLKNDAKGVAVTGKPSPSTNPKAADEGAKKEASEEATEEATEEADDKEAAAAPETDPLKELREQHVATAQMYRKMADEAEERGDFIAADTFDHKAEVCEDLSKDAAVETENPEPELAGVNDATPEIHEASDDSTEHEASEEVSNEDTDGPSEGSTKTASTEIELTDELIEAAVTPKEVMALRSAYSGQRRSEPSRVDPSASGVMRIASVDENAASNDDDVAALESLWTGAPRE